MYVGSLARQQEAQQRLMSQAAPRPVSPAVQATPRPQKDLTSTLIENQMKFSPRPQVTTNNTVPPLAPTWNMISSSPAWQQPLPLTQGFGAFQQAPQPQWQSPQPSYNLLDSLLPSASPRIPMNAMQTGPRQPLLSSSQSAKPLSTSEINDLLS
ncbi:hypothetical protein PR048_004534 [Dryococelus australis]|uniref:Uncharacterized protein n=1 Tax=Dryococelus australis TaxID=614101 RepID=A0ABQ9I6S5_9NEOP|nr:hypothetical protein PR048_004534 [Dryococelus australis]